MFTALTLSWNFIGGFTGYPSFSTAAFFGLGCYAGALSERAGVPMLLAWGIATLFVGAFAAALGAIILRLKGHYFAIGSIGVVEVVRLVISSWGSLTGGGDGLNLPLLAGGPNVVARIFLAVMIGDHDRHLPDHRDRRPRPARRSACAASSRTRTPPTWSASTSRSTR